MQPKELVWSWLSCLDSFYGLRRSEIVGLKWQNFDFANNLFTIAHTVTTYSRKGEHTVIYAKDKAKNASSIRTLPLIPLFRKKLRELPSSKRRISACSETATIGNTSDMYMSMKSVS